MRISSKFYVVCCVVYALFVAAECNSAFAADGVNVTPVTSAPPVPVPPKPAFKKAAEASLPNAPGLISPADLKENIPGLAGTIDTETKKASLEGRIDASCAKLLRLEANGTPTSQGRVLFAMYDLGGGLDCLKKTHKNCVGVNKCQTLAQIQAQTTRRISVPFRSSVTIQAKDVGDLKIAFADSAKLAADDRKKLEATAACDCDVPGTGKAAPLTPTQTKNVADASSVLDVAKKAKKKADDEEAKQLAEDCADDPTADECKTKVRPPDPGLQHVMTDEEMKAQTAKNMAPYYQMMQNSANTIQQQLAASQAQVAQQLQASALARQQQQQQGTGYLGNYNYPSIVSYGMSSSLLSGQGNLGAFASPFATSTFGSSFGSNVSGTLPSAIAPSPISSGFTGF